jgi:tetratricopeptide (TPR) repeat protein
MGKASRKREQQTQGISTAPIPASPHQSFLVKPLPAVLIVLLLSFIVNFNVLNNGFGWDDEDIIKNLRSPDYLSNLFIPNSITNPASKETTFYYRPMVSVSYLLDFMIWGHQPFGYHLSVLLAHLLNTALVFLLAHSLVRDKKPPYTFLPIIVASFFAVHPVHAEAVAWIAGRNDVFCTTFILSSVLLYIRFRRTGKEWIFGLSMLFFFFSLLTKEMAAGMALLFPLYDYLSGPASTSQARKHMSIRFLIPLMIFGLYLYLRTTRLAAPLGPAGSTDIISLETLKEVIGAAGLYLKLMIFPYPHTPFITILPTSATFLLFSTLAWGLVIGGLIFSLIHREAPMGMGLAWGIVTLSPAVWIGVVGVGVGVLPTLAAERYLYAPSAGFLMVLVWLILTVLGQIQIWTGWPVQRVWRVAGLMGMILITVWGWESWNRDGVWKNKLIFWEMAINRLPGKSPQNAVAHNNLGLAYYDIKSLDKAIERYRMAIDLKPDYADAHNNLGIVYNDQGRLEESIREYQITLKLQPNLAQAYNNLGTAYSKQGHFEEAIREYQKTLELQPDNAEAHNNLGNAHSKQGRIEEAIREYRAALELQPDNAEAHYNLGYAYSNQKHFEEAIQEYQKVLELQPGDAETYNNLGIVYNDQGHIEEAIQEYQIALKLQPNLAKAHNNMGLVYSKQGHFEVAIREYQAAIGLEPDYQNAHYNLGQAYTRLGRFEAARKQYQQVLQIKPDFLPARKALESLPK